MARDDKNDDKVVELHPGASKPEPTMTWPVKDAEGNVATVKLSKTKNLYECVLADGSTVAQFKALKFALEFLQERTSPPRPEERITRLKNEVEQLARQAPTEWRGLLGDLATRHDIAEPKLEKMIEAEIEASEKKAREQRRQEQAAERRREQREDKKTRQDQAKEREDKRKQKEADKKAERQQREKEKALAIIVKLPSAEHEGRLKILARQLGEDVEVLREEFAELRGEEEEKIKCSEVEPWAEPVDTRELLNEVTTQFGRYIIIHDRVIAPIIPLWICFAWVHDIATFSPILIFESADTGEAKTAASKVVAALTPRAYIIVEPTGPAFYRFVDRVHPTLIIDDADRLLPRRPDLAHIINASWTRGVPIPRVDASGNVHLFDPFCPKVLNGIDLLAHLAPATRTRCITIKLLPKLENEKVADHQACRSR
jgi:hypothetical protein